MSIGCLADLGGFAGIVRELCDELCRNVWSQKKPSVFHGGVNDMRRNLSRFNPILPSIIATGRAQMEISAPHSVGDVIPRLLAQLRSTDQGDAVMGITTGLPELDQLTAGLRDGDLIVIGGRPSMGKTAMATQIVLHAALQHHVPVIYFSMDLSSKDLVMRLTAATARVRLQRLRTRQLDKDDWNRIEAASRKLARAPIYLDDAVESINVLRARSHEAAAEYGLGLVVVDFIQAYRPHDANSRPAVPIETSTALKCLARELDVPVLALSQLNRRVEHRPSRYPILSDLRGPGALENDADVVMLLYREGSYGSYRTPLGDDMALLSIVKHRNGPTGAFWTVFKPDICTFGELP